MEYFADLEQNVRNALTEDVASGDITAQIIDEYKTASARIICREQAIICGVPWVNEVARQVDNDLQVRWQVADGDLVEEDQLLFTLHGKARSLLTAERTMLNFLQTLSGTATRTREYVNLVKDTNVTLLDTRKTLPGLRLAQKYAVKTGGAENHRIGLFDAFLIKENHIQAAGSITGAIHTARSLEPGTRIEVEVENLDELNEAITASPNWIMLDNFSIAELNDAVSRNQGTGIKLEASGGIEGNEGLVKIAGTGVDYISLGTLTKHCRAIDLSMRFD